MADCKSKKRKAILIFLVYMDRNHLVFMQKLILIIMAVFLAACTKTLPAVKVAEESMVQECEYVATLSETTDSGNFFYNYLSQASQDKILMRAANLRATHIVWVYDYRMGSAAIAYRCDR